MRSLESVRPAFAGWGLTLYPEAAEAGARWYPTRRRDSWAPLREAEVDVQRAEVEAARRAKGKVRRYCAANGLNRFASLTYRGVGCHEPLALRADLAAFFRALRRSLGGRPLPYLSVPEWHRTDHGLHAHFGIGRYVPRRLIESAWGHGFVHIKLIGNLPVGSGVLEEARIAARYLAKYAGKAFDVRRLKGLHRYEVAQGFQPRSEPIFGRRFSEIMERATERMGAPPSYVWRSEELWDWTGPPAAWMSWGR